MAAFQRVLDLGPASHFDVLHGGHRNRVSLVTLEPAMAKPWREKSYSHDTARALVAELADEYLDLYLSQNSFKAWRNTRNVAALTSCYVDLDTYNIPALAGLDAEEILSRAMLAFPWMPVPTMLASSGRGVYFVWVFKEPLSPDALPRWQTVEGALVGLLKGLGADAKAKDATRVLRVAGSTHAKTGERVHYAHISDAVKFSELERVVREQCVPDPPVRRESQPKAARKSGSVAPLWNGYTLAYGRMNDLEALARMRGPLSDCRARFLFAYSVAAAWYCSTPGDLVRELDDFARDFFVDAHRYRGATQCKSVLDRVAQSKRGLRVVWQGEEIDPRYRIHNRTLIELLDITPAEQTHLIRIISKTEKDTRYRMEHPLTRPEYLQQVQGDAAPVRREKRAEAEELLRQGHTATSAAHALGISRMTLHRRLNAV